MAGIVCAIRGGPLSRPTIDKAIQQALATQQEIHFLYVVNLDFLSGSLHSPIQVMTEEMLQMGEFILLATQQIAKDKNVVSHAVLRKGSVQEEIIIICQVIDADYVVLGKPHQAMEHNVFANNHINSFAQEVYDASGAQVIFADQEKE